MQTKINGSLQLLQEGAELLESAPTNTPRLDAEILLAFALGIERDKFLIDPPPEIGSEREKNYRDYLKRRVASEPVAYITGLKDFHDYRFHVNVSVLIPRPETEEMVEAILNRFDKQTRMKVCDIGTGSGNIAVTLAKKRPLWEITAVDISQSALATARLNAERLEVENIAFIESDLFGAIDGKFDLILSNPPYVDSADRESLSLEVSKYEPELALFASGRGLDVVKRILVEAPNFLHRGGAFYCEIGYDQKPFIEKLFSESVWADVEFRRDLAGHWRIVSAFKR